MMVGLLTVAAQAAVMDTVIATTQYTASDTDVFKLDGNTLGTQAQHARLWYNPVMGLDSLPNGNFIMVTTTSTATRVHLMATDNFDSMDDTNTRLVRQDFNAGGPGAGGMTNSYGEVFAAKHSAVANSNDGVTLNGLDDTFPIITDLTGGYFGQMIQHAAGDALSNGAWVLAYSNGYEWRTRNPGTRVERRINEFDAINGLAVNSNDVIGLMNQQDGNANGPRATLLRYVADLSTGSTTGHGGIHYYNQTGAAVTSLSDGTWVFATNSTNGGDATLYLLSDTDPMVELNSLTLTDVSDVNCLAIQSDDDILIGTEGGEIIRLDSALVEQARQTLTGPVTHLTTIVPEPTTLAILAAGSVLALRRRKQ
jgi:hypothetical protein